jgi:hypothetical protein
MNKGDPKVIEAYQGKKMDDNALLAATGVHDARSP